MNSKRAKLLRKVARNSLPAGTPERDYVLANNARNPVQTGTIKVVAKTFRGLYRALKRGDKRNA